MVSPIIHHCFVDSFSVLRRVTPVIHCDYSHLQSDYNSPDRNMAGGDRRRRRSVGKAFAVIWPPGIMGTRGLASAAGARAAPPTTASTSSLPTLPQLKPDRAVSRFLRRGTRTTGNPTDSRRRLGVGFRRALAGTLPEPVVRLPAGVRETGGNKAMPAAATRVTTLTRSLVSAVLQMCRTFQKSSVNRVVRTGRAACPARSCRSRGAGCLRGRHGRRRINDEEAGHLSGGHGRVGVQAFGRDDNSFAVRSARRTLAETAPEPQSSRCSMIVITDTLTGAIAVGVVTGTGRRFAVMVGGERQRPRRASRWRRDTVSGGDHGAALQVPLMVSRIRTRSGISWAASESSLRCGTKTTCPA